ncbi:MAG: EF-Tu/IF-2/RF-3 family GTPase [Candidatus Micrarchaeota archaeon]
MTICLLGAKGLGAKLGKKGTSTDVTLYNMKRNGRIFNFVEPALYPDKLSSMLTATQMSDSAVLCVSPEVMNFQLGETILALDYLQIKKGIVVLDGVIREQLEPLIKGTAVEKYVFVENDAQKIWNEIDKFSYSAEKGGAKVLIDHTFQVKSVGLVALGFVKSGEVKKYDSLRVYPGGKETMIKSIQIMDEDFDISKAGDRVGFALKTDAEVKRGDIIASEGAVLATAEVKVDFKKNSYYKNEVLKSPMVSLGLQYIQGNFDGKTVKFDKPVAYCDGDVAIMCDPGNKMRIVGAGVCRK